MMNPVIQANTAISNLRPGAKYILSGSDYSGLEWLDEDQTKPSQEEFDSEMVKVLENYELKNQPMKDYQMKRAAEYPSIGDQLDMLFHAGLMPRELAIKIQAIKTKYPKV